ncbi:unnamed protein product [Brachionus calyciflorus]|uniref:Uncharacterized protein n=1 Tax=Brachionus calyciflorus TaxID=104777 RepID=A0A813MQV5_9BILA|nr:unnamed protein product [Brachionus calyciflorus]
MKFAFIFLFFVIGLISSVPLKNNQRNPVLMISLDGFRADKLDKFLRENPESNLKKEFVDVGVKADHMEPSFPTLTFPNHYTLVTGLYMENHDVTSNTVYDSVYDQKLNFLRDTEKNNFKWWNKTEPIWFEAKKQGLKTASFFWAGSEVWQRHPDFFLKYDESKEWESRCDQIVSWFTKFDIDFGTLYFDEPDHAGHSYGPDSEQYYEAIYKLDETIGYLMKKLRQANMEQKMNVLIVSDHGMAQMNSTLIVSKYVSTNLINATKTVYGIVSNIWPKTDAAKVQIYDALKKVKELKVYYKEEIPENFHYQNSNRIAPIVAIADEGYVMNTVNQTLIGNHGFDNRIESMRAIFLARGPNFKSNVGITGLKNVDVYPLLCELIQIQCHPNNGSLVPYKDALHDMPRHKKLF